jgi:hypothetical protein
MKQDRDAAKALHELYSGAGRYPVGGDESAGDNFLKQGKRFAIFH